MGAMTFDPPRVTEAQVASMIASAGDVVRSYVEYAIPGQRARGTAYTNDTGHDLELYILSTQSTASTSIQVRIDEGLPTEAVVSSSSIQSGATQRQHLYARIPAGATYKVTTRDPEYWFELRAS